MRSFRKWCIAGCLLSAAAMHAELSEWVQHLAVDTGLRGVFFRPMELPGGTIDGRRPPRETRAALTERIAAAPKDAALYRLRAGEAELALDFPAAEADWKEYATLTGDRIALADYYHRRLQPAEEIATLDQVATPAAFERAIAEAAAQDLPVTMTIGQYRAWVGEVPAGHGAAQTVHRVPHGKRELHRGRARDRGLPAGVSGRRDDSDGRGRTHHATRHGEPGDRGV